MPSIRLCTPVADEVHHDHRVGLRAIFVEPVSRPMGVGVRVSQRDVPAVVVEPQVSFQEEEAQKAGEDEQRELQARSQRFHGLGQQVQHGSADQDACGEADQQRQAAMKRLGIPRQGDHADERKGAHQ